MGNYKDREKVKPFVRPEGWVAPPIRVNYALYRVLAPHLKAEGVDPLTRLIVLVPEFDDEEDE